MRNYVKILACAVLAVSMCAVPATSYAATIEEAIAIARQYGIPEETIQECLNMYYEEPELYTPEVIDDLIAKFEAYKGEIITNVPYDPNGQVPSVTVTTPAPVDNPGSEDVPVDDSITLTMPDGTTFTRISAEKFIALSYEEKITYLSTFPEDKQTIIIDNLSPEEYKSLLKQLPTEDKLDVIDSLTDISDSMGVNLTVNELTDNSVSFQMKNKDGELIGSSSINDVIEDTGYDRRGIFAVAGACIMTGIVGIFMLVKKCFGAENE